MKSDRMKPNKMSKSEDSERESQTSRVRMDRLYDLSVKNENGHSVFPYIKSKRFRTIVLIVAAIVTGIGLGLEYLGAFR